jgi:large subunit ribosomal protein L15
MSRIATLPSIIQRPKKRVGRGIGSGKGGHTSGRGQKGQLSRQGAKIPLWFEGGQLPLVKRLPMLRGKGLLKPTSRIVSLTLKDLNTLDAGTVTLDSLKLAQIIPQMARGAKIIATGVIQKKMIISSGVIVTAAAQTAIEAAGGSVQE